ncbi:winged helix-turn-helix domain-containing protein [Mesorhizobium sp.]|uniref:winged helix-turn-helix domain-containing protein n=1 Tax=Mesorhizobium sp. TaxID=1871066 RepID=UPI00338EB965
MDYPRSIRFGDFVLNRTRGCLQDSSGTERFLRPKSYRVLEVLAERRGQLVSKDDLVQATWPDVFVSDDSLAQCVSDIRRALGPEGMGLLRTVPRRGYMLVGPGSEAEEPVEPGWKRWMAWTSGLTAALIVAMATLWLAQPRDSVVELSAADGAVVQANELITARDWRRRGDNEEARGLLEAVVADNPGHAGAWASLGLTYWLEVQHLAWGGGRREMARALEMVERAVALGGGARSHRLLAEMRLLSPFPEMRSPVDALANARAAVTIDPEDPSAGPDRPIGRGGPDNPAGSAPRSDAAGLAPSGRWPELPARGRTGASCRGTWPALWRRDFRKRAVVARMALRREPCTCRPAGRSGQGRHGRAWAPARADRYGRGAIVRWPSRRKRPRHCAGGAQVGWHAGLIPATWRRRAPANRRTDREIADSSSRHRRAAGLGRSPPR